VGVLTQFVVAGIMGVVVYLIVGFMIGSEETKKIGKSFGL